MMRRSGIMLLLGATLVSVQESHSGNLPYESTLGAVTAERAMLSGTTNNTNQGWKALPLVTVGEAIGGYRPLGLLDGIGAFALNPITVRVLANHEAGAAAGYGYTLANGTQLTGSRISAVDLGRFSRKVLGAGLAFDAVYDRAGQLVTGGAQINEGQGAATDGFDRFCSAWFGAAGSYGLVDDIYFTGEETSGGQGAALDVRNGDLWVVPMLGRAAFENIVMIAPPAADKAAFVIGDDRQGSPLLLYIGTKNALGDGGFLDRNGLASGDLYAWVSDGGDQSPQDFHGTGAERDGGFVRIVQYDASQAGQPGWDALGYATQSNIDGQVSASGAYRFSRPEDLSTNPQNGLQFAFASTGRGQAYPADNWGDTYIVDVAYGPDGPRAHVKLVYDGDDAGAGQFQGPDYGLRSPDNIDWAADGFVYAQEDKSTSPGSLFGGTSGAEASIWRIDPASGVLTRILEMDRSAVPAGQTDSAPTEIGNWESSGVLDVTHLFSTWPGETLLLADVQGHSLVGDPLGGVNQANDLVEGGQLLLLTNSDNNGIAPTQHGHIHRDDRSSDDSPVAHTGDAVDAAGGVVLHRNAPNPAAPATTFSFATPGEGIVRFEVVDLSGRIVRTLIDSSLSAGNHAIAWSGMDASGVYAPAGVYFYRLTTAQGTLQGKMLVTK